MWFGDKTKPDLAEDNRALRTELRKTLRKNSGLGWDRLPALVPPPDVLVDVGAAGGTKRLYRAFPEARLVLIDPLRENRARLERIAETRPAEIFEMAVGATRCSMPLHVGDGSGGISSLLSRTGPLAERIVETRSIEVHRLDELVEATGTIGLKIDAEGYEREVILGAEHLLPSVQWVVAEISMYPRFKGDPLFGGVYEALAPHGFIFRDVLAIVRQRQGDLRRIDALFIRPELLEYAATAHAVAMSLKGMTGKRKAS